MRSKPFILFLLLITFNVSFAQEKANVIPVQKQLDAYNARDIDAFLEPYSDTVKIYTYPNRLTLSGKENMRKGYGAMFENTPDLHCTLINRMVLGNTVIDQEYVIRQKNGPVTQVIAMYKIAHGKIQEVYFIRPELEDEE